MSAEGVHRFRVRKPEEHRHFRIIWNQIPDFQITKRDSVQISDYQKLISRFPNSRTVSEFLTPRACTRPHSGHALKSESAEEFASEFFEPGKFELLCTRIDVLMNCPLTNYVEDFWDTLPAATISSPRGLPPGPVPRLGRQSHSNAHTHTYIHIYIQTYKTCIHAISREIAIYLTFEH